VCACINANDPLRDMRSVLERLKGMGVMSVSNIGPSISYVDKGTTIYNVLTKSGITFDHEVEMLALAKEMDMVTVALAFDMEDSMQVVEEARPDIFCFHAGTTRGGLTGYDSGETIEETAARTREVCAALRKIEPSTILVGHVAAMETPEDVQYMLNHSTCDGFWTGSSTERLPIERAVLGAAQEFASLRFPEAAETTESEENA
jgi:predicted TIM-barrel enzyme